MPRTLRPVLRLSLRFSVRWLAPVVALSLLMTSCASDDDPEADEPSSESSGPSEPETSEPTESTEPTESPSPSATEASGLTQPVSEEAEQEYLTAIANVAEAFTTFGRDYQRAVDKRGTKALLKSARGLRDAVFGFDAELRSMDLAPVQEGVNAVLDITGQFITALDEAATATSGRQAIKILDTMPFQEFTAAFTELAAQIRGA